MLPCSNLTFFPLAFNALYNLQLQYGMKNLFSAFIWYSAVVLHLNGHLPFWRVSSDFIEDIPYAFAMNLFPSSCAHILKFRSIHGISIQSFLHFLFFVSLIFRMVQFRYFIFSLTLSSMWSFLLRFLKGLLSFSTFFSVWIFSSIQILFSFLLLIHFHTYIHWVDTLILM